MSYSSPTVLDKGFKALVTPLEKNFSPLNNLLEFCTAACVFLALLISFNSSSTLVNWRAPSIAVSKPLATFNPLLLISPIVLSLLAAFAVTAAVDPPPVNGANTAPTTSSAMISPIIPAV